MRRHVVAPAAIFATAALALAACGGGGGGSGSSTTSAAAGNSPSSSTPATGSGATTSTGGAALPDLSGKTITVDAVWTGAEQKTFKKVTDAFTKQTGAKVQYTSTGDQIATVLGTKVKGGSPPDVAMLPQPGLLSQFAKAGNLKPLSSKVSDAVDANYSSIWHKLGSVNGKLYGVWFDASNKSTLWYNTTLFQQAGIANPPKTWDEFIKDAKTLSDAGIQAPVSIGGADGWTLTDWFENVYIRQAGTEKYDKLATHAIKWTDPSVHDALKTLQQLFGDTQLIGSASSALQTDFPHSVINTFSDKPKSAMVYEGSFVAGVITSETKSKIGTDAKWVPFPSVDGSGPAVVGGGDVAVAFNDDPATMAFLQYLASPDAAAQMVSTGSFTSSNKSMPLSAYPDPNSTAVGKAIVEAGNNFRFDMSDQAPSAFGGTVGKGEWGDMQSFLRNPSDITGIQKKLESDAAAAFGK
jgi:ABC-type glycerol-3-phosphate transport system substrate-binding protein